MQQTFDKFFAIIQPLDLDMLRWLNVKMTHPLLDQFWHFITHMHKNWVVMGVIVPSLLLLLVYRYRWQALRPLLMLGLTVGLVDAIAYRGIKSQVFRQRPFQNSEVSSWVRKIGEAHGSSFPSNHAANCFAGAAILAWYFSRYRNFFYTLAALIALSRVALGVHYPSDILAGSMLGIFVALLVRFFILTRFTWLWVDKPQPIASPHFSDWRTRSRRMSGH